MKKIYKYKNLANTASNRINIDKTSDSCTCAKFNLDPAFYKARVKSAIELYLENDPCAKCNFDFDINLKTKQ